MLNPRVKIVLSAIRSADEPALEADEVDDIRTHFVLPYELSAARGIPQSRPQTPLGVCHVAAKIPGSLIGHGSIILPILGATLPLWEGRNLRASAKRISGRGTPPSTTNSLSVSLAYPSPNNPSGFLDPPTG